MDSAFLAIPGGSVGQAKVQPNNVIVISAGTGGQCAAAYQLQTGQFLRAGRNLTAIEEAKNASGWPLLLLPLLLALPGLLDRQQLVIITSIIMLPACC